LADPTAYFHLSGKDLPADADVVRYRAREAVSQPFEVIIEFASKETGFEVEKCLRKSYLLTIVDGLGKERVFHGVCDQAEFIDLIGEHSGEFRMYYRITLRPALWGLRYIEDCRIWQQKNVKEIIDEVFTASGIDGSKVDWQQFQTYEPREFCVQYRESRFNFVSRLMEDEGLFYFFRHTPDGHKMVIGDDPNAFQPSDDAPEVRFAMSAGLGIQGEPLADFQRTRSLRTSAVLLKDYDFEKPQNAPMADKSAEENVALPFYAYPGGFKKSDAGKRRAAAMLASRRRDSDVVRGSSRAIGMRTGVPFFVEGGEPEWINGDFVCIELLSWGDQSFQSKSENFACKNSFSGVPVDAPWAPPRVTPKPRIRGIQTAVVTGSSGDDQSIYCDKYARVKVHFHWDRVGQKDQNCSCWLRTQQLVTSGFMFLPRVGWELAIGFFEGDPDKPFCLGRIYNGEQTAALGLPGAKASGSFRGHSTPGGGGQNSFNAGDGGGSQNHGVHAQKDMNTTIGNDKNETIAVDEEHNVKVNLNCTVGADETISVGANQTITIGSMYSQKVSGNQTITVGGMEADNAESNYVEKVSGNRSYTVGGMYLGICNGIDMKGTAGITRTVGAVAVRGAVGAISDNVAAAYNESIGAVKLELVKGVSSEAVGGVKMQQMAAAEVHIISGNLQQACNAAITNLVGGLHYQKLDGDYSLKGKMITLLGAVGVFKGGSSDLKLGGGPVTVKGSKIALKGALIVKMGTSLKMGSG
jgi:type VI secretion system secreted protein VgrG